jgi:hypothetical protein
VCVGYVLFGPKIDTAARQRRDVAAADRQTGPLEAQRGPRRRGLTRADAPGVSCRGTLRPDLGVCRV